MKLKRSRGLAGVRRGKAGGEKGRGTMGVGGKSGDLARR